MNRIFQLVLALTCLAAAAVPAPAQDSKVEQLGILDGKNILGRIEVMLSHRQQLKLTSEQVAGLEQIKREFEERNAPLYREVERILSENPAGSASLAELRERPDLNPVFEQMRTNNQAVFTKLKQLLTEDQLQAGNYYFRNSRTERRDRAAREPS